MVEDHQGFIRAFSDGKSQTKFLIELPVVESPEEKAKIVRANEKDREGWV
jgi:hypothetical protein